MDHHLKITLSYAFNGDLEGAVRGICCIPRNFPSHEEEVKGLLGEFVTKRWSNYFEI